MQKECFVLCKPSRWREYMCLLRQITAEENMNPGKNYNKGAIYYEKNA